MDSFDVKLHCRIYFKIIHVHKFYCWTVFSVLETRINHSKLSVVNM